jgi:hypothetical protein
MNRYRLVRTRHYARCGGRLRQIGVVNQVLDHTPGGPCLTPVRFPIPAPGGETLVLVPCGQRLRRDFQCDNCRVEVQVVEERRIVHPAPAPALFVDSPRQARRGAA